MNQVNQQDSRRRQQCRRTLSGNEAKSGNDPNFAGLGRGSENCRNRQSNQFRAQASMAADQTPNRSGLQLLREQMERLTKSLEEIQARVGSGERR